VPRVLSDPKAAALESAGEDRGRGAGALGGVLGRGAYEEDGPVIWESPLPPW